ncbi:TonB family protein [Methylopila sp. 73B]|uniref:energy transducer TonB family protein n=1 Tax=Methylopila sp. 73B TaxID=1120792 RepID=UPI00037019E0|nr:TonB family protein [Methylopila sp. 73B]
MNGEATAEALLAPRARPLARAELARWPAAGLAVLALHVGVAAWLLRQPPAQPADGAPPPAVMIDLAPEPEAANTETTDISADAAAAEASAPAEAEPVEEAQQESAEMIEPEPMETDEPPLEEVAAAEVAGPRPRARPAPPTPVREARRPRPRRDTRERPMPQQAQAQSRSAVQAQAQVPQSHRTAASRSSVGISAAASTWQARLMAHLERRKRYPSGAQSRGVAYVRFTINDSGAVLSAALARSSGFAELDAEVLALVRRASPLPPPPQGANRTITAPVKFDRR